MNSYSSLSVCPSVRLSRPPNGQSLQGVKSMVAPSTAGAARGLGGRLRSPSEFKREPFTDNNSFKVSLHGILTPPHIDFFSQWIYTDVKNDQNWSPRGWIRPIGWKFGGLLSVTLLEIVNGKVKVTKSKIVDFRTYYNYGSDWPTALRFCRGIPTGNI